MNHNVNMEIPAATAAQAEADDNTNNSCILNDEPMDQQQENLHDNVCILIPILLTRITSYRLLMLYTYHRDQGLFLSLHWNILRLLYTCSLGTCITAITCWLSLGRWNSNPNSQPKIAGQAHATVRESQTRSCLAPPSLTAGGLSDALPSHPPPPIYKMWLYFHKIKIWAK